MKCLLCRSNRIMRGTTTVTLERGGCIVVFKEVPANVCSTCGEPYVDERTTEKLLSIAKQAAATGVEVDVRRYVAA